MSDTTTDHPEAHVTPKGAGPLDPGPIKTRKRIDSVDLLRGAPDGDDGPNRQSIAGRNHQLASRTKRQHAERFTTAVYRTRTDGPGHHIHERHPDDH